MITIKNDPKRMKTHFIRRAAAVFFAVLLSVSVLPAEALAEGEEDLSEAAKESPAGSEEEEANRELKELTGADDSAFDDDVLMAEGFDESLYGESEGVSSGENGTVLYFIPHQDDDILTFSCGIIKELRENKDVHVILFTDGRSSAAFDEINAELRKKKKKQITLSEFIAARDKEFRSSLKALGVAEENIHIPEDRLIDGTTKEHMDKLTEIMIRYLDEYPGAGVRANMPVAGEVRVHTDHADIGLAAADLCRSGRIGELLLFIDSYRYSTYKNAGLPATEITPGDFLTDWKVMERIRFNSAVLAYRYGSEYGVGYRSSGYLMEQLRADPHSYYYTYHPQGVVRYGGSNRYETALSASAGTPLEGTSEANFKAPELMRRSGTYADACGSDPAPDTPGILVYDDRILAPHRGSGTSKDEKGDSTRPGGTLVLAYGGNFPDALAAASLGSEIMLTRTASLSDEARSEILRTLPGRIVIMGSEGVISENVVKAIYSLPDTVTQEEQVWYYGADWSEGRRELVYRPEIVRCGGKNRFETALALAKRFEYQSTTNSVIVTTGMNYADAVSIAPYAAKTGTPILLASKGDLTSEAYTYLGSIKGLCTQAILVGGSSVVSESCRKKLEGMGLSTVRISGADRYETSAKAAEYCVSSGVGLDASCISVAVGNNYPDALIAGPITANNGSVLILCHSKVKNWSVCLRWAASHKEEVAARGYRFCLFGSEGVVSRAAKELLLASVA